MTKHHCRVPRQPLAALFEPRLLPRDLHDPRALLITQKSKKSIAP